MNNILQIDSTLKFLRIINFNTVKIHYIICYENTFKYIKSHVIYRV